MNKILLLAGVLIVLSFASCKEKGAVINVSGTKPVDTTYVANIEPAQPKMVLIEEFTGAACPPCPKGHAIIYGNGGIKDQHPDQVAVIAYHVNNLPQTEPIHGHSKFDFRTQDATDVATTVLGITQIPLGGIDRTINKGTHFYDRDEWSQAVNVDILEKPAANVYITSSYNAATRNATVKVKIAYTQKVSKKQNITLALIENDIIDAQKQDIDIIDNYTHKSVLRDIITLYYGEPVLDNLPVKEPGRVYERSFTFNVNPAWNADNCQLVAFVHNNEGDDKYVVQAADVNLK